MFDLAVKKSPVSRRDADGLDAEGNKSAEKKFNGFLQSFLGGTKYADKRAAGAGYNRHAENKQFFTSSSQNAAGKSRRSAFSKGNKAENDLLSTAMKKDGKDKQNSQISKAAEKMSIRDRGALRRALEKTVADDEYFQSLTMPEDTAAAGIMADNGETPGAVDTAVLAAEEGMNQDAGAGPTENAGDAGAAPGASQDATAAPDADAADAPQTGGAAAGVYPEATDSDGALDDALDEMLGDVLAPETAPSPDSAAGVQHNANASGQADVGAAESESLQDSNAAENTAEISVDPEVAKAAEEAAALILSLLFPASAEAGRPGPEAGESSLMADRLAEIASLLGEAGGKTGARNEQLAGLGTTGVVGDELAESIETTNVSAEMNIDAVLSALDELLDGMPRNVLDQALDKLTAHQGSLDELAAALGLDSLEYSQSLTASQDLLKALALSGQHPETMTEISEASAESAGKTAAKEGISGSVQALLKEISQENSSGSPITEPGTGAAPAKSIVAKVAAGLADGSINASNINKIEGGAAALASLLKSLDTHMSANADSLTDREIQDFSAFRSNLESMLQKTWGNSKAADPATTTSTMLDQMANIERLTEMVRLANRRSMHNLTMQLSPPELGKVTIRVESKNGVLTALFRVEHAESAAQLQNGLQQLKDNLKASGIELSEVEIRQQNADMGAGGGNHGRDARETPGAESRIRSGARTGNSETTGTEDVPEQTETRFNPNGNLNFFA